MPSERRRPRSGGLRRCTLCAALIAAAGCEIEEIGIPRTEARLALHGVLSASAASQVVLLERTRNGSVFVLTPPFDLVDPIGSDEGIAESGAAMQLTTPGGQTLVATEESVLRGDGKGEGVYRFALPGSALERGRAYRLTVLTRSGEQLSAETSVPEGVPAAAGEPGDFDRSADPLVLEWPAAPGARSYLVRIETPFGPRSFFTGDTTVRLTGELRNVDVDALPRVFVPGFQQAVTVSAVDGNYYDWYRTRNDPLAGTGLISRVEGGLGVFGSLVRLRFRDLHVVAPQSESAAGHFEFDGSPEERASALVLAFELYVESPAARSDQGDALSGRYRRRPTLAYRGPLIAGTLGTVRNGRLELALLREWSARDTVDVLTGEIRGDTIVGVYRFAGGPVRFVKGQ